MPTKIISLRERQPQLQMNAQVGCEHQLAINVRLGSTFYRSYVIHRSGADFSEADLALAAQIQRLVIGLDGQVCWYRRLSSPEREREIDAGLTVREQTVLMLLADGLSTQQIAHRLQCSPGTVHKHLERTYRKLGVRDRVNALGIAQEWKLTGHVDRPVVRSDPLSPGSGGLDCVHLRTSAGFPCQHPGAPPAWDSSTGSGGDPHGETLMERPSVSRRALLGGAAVAGFGLAFTGSLEAFARPEPKVPGGGPGYGPLLPDPNGILSLPAGFSYTIVAQSNVTKTDDLNPDGKPYLCPSDPDGMGVFAGDDGGSVLVSNHENSASELARVPTIQGLDLAYDPLVLDRSGKPVGGAIGGTSTLTVDHNGTRLGTYTSLSGTDNNCAGGITPWGTWLTCEETERKAGTVIGGRKLAKDHGFVFEVDPRGREANVGRSPLPLSFLGRYSHEAVAVDPDSHRMYLTEDAITPNGLYYRWTPPPGFIGAVGALHDLALTAGAGAGRLQAMSCWRGRRHIVDLSEATEVGTRYQVRWVDVPDRLAAATSTRLQTYAEPITRSRKLEGAWWGNGGAYFVASFARPLAAGDGSLNEHDGQVWFYDPESKSVTLKTLFAPNPQPEEPYTWDGPDNITVSPHGGLIVAEDGEGKNHLIGVGRRGEPYALARNDQAEEGEFCGPAFSNDGRILFANIQSPTFGVTLAITGPWHRER